MRVPLLSARNATPWHSGTYCHNHFGLGTANRLAAIAAGADVVHVPGLGEGSGNTPIEEVVMGKKSGTYTIYLWLERIARTVTEEQVNAILAKVKDWAIREQRLLSEDEFVVFVNEVLGPSTGKEKRGTPVLDLGSAKHEMVDKVATAPRIAQERRPDLAIDVEFHLDTALMPFVAAKKVKRSSEVAGRANVLVWPDLQMGNIAGKR